MPHDFALILPCYNEADRLTATFEKIVGFFSNTNYWKDKKIALIFVNDGSTDATATLLNSLSQRQKNIEIIVKHLEKNQGKGYAIKAGVESLAANSYGFIDADLALPLESITAMHAQLSHADMIIGKRKLTNSSSYYQKLRTSLSRLLQKIVLRATNIPDLDTQCGLKVFSKKTADLVFSNLTQYRFSFDIELIILALREHLTITSHEVTYQHDGRSSVTPGDGVRYILDVAAISDRYQQGSWHSFLLKNIVVATVITGIFFGWTLLYGYFFSDDFTWLWHGSKINGNINSILTFHMSSFYSPVLNAFYTFFYPIAGFSAQWYFLVGLLIHISVATFAGIQAHQITKSRIAGYTTTLFVAIAGGAYEPLVWIGANMHSIATLFILLTTTSYYQYLQTTKVRYLITSVVALLLALGTKEIAVVAPILLLMLLIKSFTEKQPATKKILHWIAVAGVATLFTAYLYQQYLWQHESVWITAGAWKLDPLYLLRIPLAFIDMIVPIKTILSNSSALLLVAGGLFTITTILWRYRRLWGAWIGIIWMITALLPVIFFSSDHWWDLIASRYTYLSRVGLGILVATLLSHHILKNTSRKIIHGSVIILIAATLAQTWSMSLIIQKEYSYVYASGRTLETALNKKTLQDVQTVYVDWNRPFTNNYAHIVGVIELQSPIKESSIIFLKKGEAHLPTENEALLAWNEHDRTYLLEKNH